MTKTQTITPKNRSWLPNIRATALFAMGLSLLMSLVVAQSAYASSVKFKFYCPPTGGGNSYGVPKATKSPNGKDISVTCSKNKVANGAAVDSSSFAGSQVKTFTFQCPGQIPPLAVSSSNYQVFACNGKVTSSQKITCSGGSSCKAITPTLSSSGSGSTSSGGSGSSTSKKCTANDCSIPNYTDKALGVKCTQTNCNLITKYVNPAINLLSAAVGIVVVSAIIIGAIQFSSSSGDPQRAALAKRRISNAIIALLAFLFLYAFLQFLIPGGYFNG